MTNTKALNKILNAINELRAAYPEQDRLIDEMVECVMYDVYDADDVVSYMHENNIILNKLFNAIDIEAFDNRELSDDEYAATIREIERIAINIEGDIDEYTDHLIYIYHIYD